MPCKRKGWLPAHLHNTSRTRGTIFMQNILQLCQAHFLQRKKQLKDSSPLILQSKSNTRTFSFLIKCQLNAFKQIHFTKYLKLLQVWEIEAYLWKIPQPQNREFHFSPSRFFFLNTELHTLCHSSDKQNTFPLFFTSSIQFAAHSAQLY